MALKPNPTQLAETLDGMRGVKIQRVNRLTGGQIVLSFTRRGQSITFLATITDVLEAPDLTEWQRRKAVGRPAGQSAFDRGYTEEDTERLDLPHYYAESWLRRMKEQHGSFAEIERVTGGKYKAGTLMQAAHAFGWEREKPGRDAERLAIRDEWRAGARNKKKLAEKYKVSIGSVSNWVGDLS